MMLKGRDDSFLGMPRSAWLSSLGSMVLGSLILCVPFWLEHRHRGAQFIATHPSWKEVGRDIGIAFIVAGVVSLIYEFSTRSTAEHQKLHGVLQAVMATYIPEELWEEVKAEVLHRSTIRRNLKFNFRLFREGKLPNGQDLTLPVTQAVLWTEVQYELYALVTGNAPVEVRHYLDQHMRNESLDLPRFERVEVTQSGGESVIYEGSNWGQIYSKERGCIEFAGKDAIKLRHLDEDKPATVHIYRYEIVNAPGLYTMIMPEMVVPISKKKIGLPSSSPTIQLEMLSPMPEGIELKVQTWFPTHEFKMEEENKKWVFDGVLLPGQGFSLVFKVRVTEAEMLPPAGQTQVRTQESPPGSGMEVGG